MKKKVFMLIMTLILTAELMAGCSETVGGKNQTNGGSGGKYAWVLVDIKDHQLSETKRTEENFEFTYTFDYSRGSYGVRSVYDGETREFFKIIHGETYGARCEFSEPPQTIGVGETVTLDVSMTETENTLSGWLGIVHGYAEFVGAEQGFTASSSEDITFRLDDTDSEDSREDNWWPTPTLDTEKGISFIETKISAIPPEGKRGDRIALRLVFNISASAIGTDYIYELQKL